MIVGIDPGQSGAFAVMNRNGDIMEARKLPTCNDGIDCAALAELLPDPVSVDLVVLEKVHSLPKQGVASSFKFGRTLGRIEGVLAVIGYSVEMPSPQRWKKAVLVDTAKSKGDTIEYCRRRWPNFSLVPPGCRVPDDNIADSICIAEFGRRLLVGKEA